MDDTPNATTDADSAVNSSLIEKLGFVVWGVRYFDIIILMAYPTMGAMFAIEELNLQVILRFTVFSLLNFLFVTSMYIFNDWSDARLNPEEPKRRSRHALKHPFISSRQVLIISQMVSIVALIGFAFLSWRLLLVAVLIYLLTTAYSHPRINLKGRPVISTAIHFTGAALYFMGGWAVFMPFSIKEVCLGIFFGLILAAGHFSNEIEDFELDMAAGIRTNAIAFGQRFVFRVGLFLFVLSSGFFIYVATEYLEFTPYTIVSLVLFFTWLIQSFRYRHWKGGEMIHSFRNFYRFIYALLCALFILIKSVEWIA
jgi:4-hydroxybenzoate polyprenyltransferase